MSEISIDTLKTMLANLDDAKKYQSLRDAVSYTHLGRIRPAEVFHSQPYPPVGTECKGDRALLRGHLGAGGAGLAQGHDLSAQAVSYTHLVGLGSMVIKQKVRPVQADIVKLTVLFQLLSLIHISYKNKSK